MIIDYVYTMVLFTLSHGKDDADEWLKMGS